MYLASANLILSWERGNAKICQAAFDALPNKSDILRRAQDKNKDANSVINKLKSEILTLQR